MSGSEPGVLQTGVRVFDLYDFFVMLVPGATLILGLLPLAPASTPFSTVGLLVILIFGGYVLGRAVHVAAEEIEYVSEQDTHRTLFDKVVRGEIEQVLPPSAVDEFYAVATDRFDTLDWPNDRAALSDNQAEMLYVLSRGELHLEMRARANSFQAIFAFHRSMYLVTWILGLAFIIYAILEGFAVQQATFRTVLGTLELPTGAVVVIGEVIIIIGLWTFRNARSYHRRNYIQYFIGDYLTLHKNRSRDV